MSDPFALTRAMGESEELAQALHDFDIRACVEALIDAVEASSVRFDDVQREAVVFQPDHQAAAAAPAGAATGASSKRAASHAAFRHIKLQGVMVHVHPSLDDEEINSLLKHLWATGYGAAKDLFLLVCDIEGAILVVSPRVLPKTRDEGDELACDHIARVGDVDVRVLTPMLIHCLTDTAKQALENAVTGVTAYLDEWCLLCSKPSRHPDADIALGVSLQVIAYAFTTCIHYVVHF